MPAKKEILKEKGVVGVSDPPEEIRVYFKDNESAVEFPEEIEKKKVKKIVSGEFKFQGLEKQRVRPLFGGVSISSIVKNSAGTLGFIDKNGIGYTALHTLLGGKIVIQPGLLDLGDKTDIIGEVIEILPHKDIAKIKVNVNYTNEILGIGEVKGIRRNVSINEFVRKYGRTTGYTEGYIIDNNVSINIEGIVFDNLILATKMSDFGDSGSAVVDKNGNVIGLVIAGSDRFTAISPL